MVVRSFKPVPKHAIYVQVAKSVSGNQDCIGLMQVSDKVRIECLIWVGQELLQFESTCDQCRQRYWSETLRHIDIQNAGIRKCFPKFFFPNNPRPDDFMADTMMHAAMEVIDESPLSALVDIRKIEIPVIIKSAIGLRHGVSGDSIVVHVVDSEVKVIPESVKEFHVVRKFGCSDIKPIAKLPHVTGQFLK